MLALLGAGSAQALTLEPVGNFDRPTYVTSDPGDAGRLLVAEREGTIQLVEGGSVTEFADLSPEVGCAGTCQGERGLMSIALSPTFAADGRAFAFYANDVDGTLHVDELVSSDPGHDSATRAGELFSVPHPDANTHNGGQLQFGPDGYLYASTGDGGGTNDQFHNAQDPTSLLGKILRVDVDAPSPAIWNLGLRNPFRFSFDRLTGDMAIGDVGQAAREEIDFAPSPVPGLVAGGEGFNYGWNCREGLLPGVATDPECALLPPSAFVDPVFDYPHLPDPDFGGGERCAVIGGYVVRDPGLGGLYGNYVYTDLCSGVLRSLRLPASGGRLASGDCSLGLQVSTPVSFGEDAAGQVYVVERDGEVLRIEGLPPASCPVPPPPPQPETGPDLSPTFIGIKAQRRRVERGKAAVLTVWVSPCKDRRGDVVALHRNGRRNGSKFLSRACTARFLRRVHRNAVFTAATFTDQEYEAGDSRRLRIRIVPRHRAAGPSRQ